MRGSNSDDNELRLEERPKSARMWIDDADLTDNLFAFFGFIICLISGVGNATVGPRTQIPQRKEWRFTVPPNKTLPALVYEYDINPLTAQNRFMKLDLGFWTANKRAIPPLTFNFSVIGQTRGGPDRLLKTHLFTDVNYTVLNQHKANNTNLYRIYEYHFLDFDSALFSVQLLPEQIPWLRGMFCDLTIGTPSYSVYQSYARFSFSLFHIWAIYKFCQLVNYRNFHLWTLEQRFTFPGLVLALLANNPLFFFFSYSCHMWVPILENIAAPIFHGYTTFLALALLARLIHGYGPVQSYPRWEIDVALAISVLIGVVEYANAIEWFTRSFVVPAIPPSTFKNGLKFYEEVAHWLFMAWALFRMTKIRRAMWSQEPMKLRLYFLAVWMRMAYSIVGIAVHNRKKVFTGAITRWTFEFLIYNFVLIFLGYLHGPYPFEDREWAEDGPAGGKGDGMLKARVEDLVDINDLLEDHEEENDDSD
jgi:hypothetical protein